MSIIEMRAHQMANLIYTRRTYSVPIVTGYSVEHQADIAEKNVWVIQPGQKISIIDGKGVFCKICPQNNPCPIEPYYDLMAKLLLEQILGKPSFEFTTDDLWYKLTYEDARQLSMALGQ